MDTFEEYVQLLNEVEDERIEDLFAEVGIEIDLNKPWDSDF